MAETGKTFQKVVLPSDIRWGYLKIPREWAEILPHEGFFDIKMGTKRVRRTKVDRSQLRIWVGRRAFEGFKAGDRVECRKIREKLYEILQVSERPKF